MSRNHPQTTTTSPRSQSRPIQPSAYEEMLRDSLRHKFIYSMTGMILGLVCILGGVFLFLRGVTGSTSWSASILGNESKLSDAAPGVILFIIGLFMVIVTRYKVKIEYGNNGNDSHAFISYRAAPPPDTRP